MARPLPFSSPLEIRSRLRALLGIGALLLLALPASALDPQKALSQYGHRSWSTDDGLPINQVVALAQSSEGYLWAGTAEGFARFDGLRFRLWDHRNTPQLGSHDIRVLAPGTDGSLWLGTVDGLYRLRGDRVEAVPGPGGRSLGVISALLAEPDGTLWVGTQGAGLIRLGPHGGQSWTREQGLPTDVVWALHRDRSGALWIGCREGLARLTGERLENLSGSAGLLAGSVLAFAESAGEGLVLGGRWGLCRYRDGRFEPFGAGRQATMPRVFALALDRDGNLWVGGDAGLARHHDGRWESVNETNGLAGRMPRSLLVDREGSLWIGTDNGGLEQLLDPRLVVYGKPEGLPDDTVTALLEDHLGRIWLGTALGLARLDADRVSVWTQRDGLAFDWINSLAETPDGTLWVGTTGGLSAFRDGRFRSYRVKDGLPKDIVNSLHVDRQGRLWIGTDGGLSRFDGGGFTTWSVQDGLTCPYVSAIADARDGGLWLGSSGGGLMHFANGRVRAWAEKEGLTTGNVTAFHEDERGVLWFATEGGGLYRLEGEKLARFSSADGLYDDVGWLLLEDGQHELWQISNRGIFGLARAALDARAGGGREPLRCRVLGRSDGLRELRGTGGGMRSRDGRLWFATTGGVAVVDPAALAAPSEAPPVVIEEVLADGQALEHAAGGQALTLPAGLRRLEVRYAALAFRSPEQAHFAGQLEGFDPAPVDLGHARSVTYTNLGPGFYRLALAAATEGGPLPPPGELLRFRLRPRFYQTPWFLGLAALSVLLAGLGFYRLRLAALTARYEAVLAERTRIARELHDTLAQDLTAALLHLRRTQAESGRGAPSLASALDSCRGLVEASLAAARRSVASLRQPLERQAGLHQSLEKLAEEARRTTSAEVVLEVATQAPSLAPEVEENLLAIAHEALVNAVRHAAAGRIRLVLGNGDQRLRLAVEDDGLGFEPAQAGENGHYGLLGMRERAAAIGAEVAIDSHTGAGTRVEITLARPRLWSRR